MDKYLPLKIQKSIGKNIQAIFEGKATILEKYFKDMEVDVYDISEQYLKSQYFSSKFFQTTKPNKKIHKTKTIPLPPTPLQPYGANLWGSLGNILVFLMLCKFR